MPVFLNSITVNISLVVKYFHLMIICELDENFSLNFIEFFVRILELGNKVVNKTRPHCLYFMKP